MQQIQQLAATASSSEREILCFYVNATSQMQIARIANIPNAEFEKVVFPGQRLSFLAQPEAVLEIYTSNLDRIILADRIICGSIQVDEETSILRSLKAQFERQLAGDYLA